jgi:hypothetical protein
VLSENLRHELMTDTQLSCKLRQHGVRRPEEVAEAWMEGDGHVSVIKKADHPPTPLEAGAREPPAAAEVRAFLDAARRLDEKVARHRQIIAEQERGIAEAEENLAQFGFRAPSSGSVQRGKANRRSPPDGRADRRDDESPLRLEVSRDNPTPESVAAERPPRR